MSTEFHFEGKTLWDWNWQFDRGFRNGDAAFQAIYIYTAWLGMLLEMFYGRKESAGGVSKGSITGWRVDVDIFLCCWFRFFPRTNRTRTAVCTWVDDIRATAAPECCIRA